MIAKSVLFLAIILLVKEANSLECYECAALTMDQCNSWMKSVTCEAGQDHCFKYWGGHENHPLAKKGCGVANECDIFRQHPDYNVQQCSVCTGNNCNNSSLITSKPLVVVILFAVTRKLFG